MNLAKPIATAIVLVAGWASAALPGAQAQTTAVPYAGQQTRDITLELRQPLGLTAQQVAASEALMVSHKARA